MPFARFRRGINFTSEQFWGRAARAPRSRKRSGRSSFWVNRGNQSLGMWRPASERRSPELGNKKGRARENLWPITKKSKWESIGRDRKVDRDLGLGFNRFAALKMRLEMPLPDGVFSGRGQDVRAADDAKILDDSIPAN